MTTAEHSIANPMRLVYEVSEQDFVAAAELAIVKRTRLPIGPLAAVPAIGAILILIALTLPFFGVRMEVSPLQAFGALFLLLPAFSRRRFRHLYRRASGKPARGETRGFEVGDNSLHLWTADKARHTNWRDYRAFSENARTFLLLPNGDGAFVPIPKHALNPLQIAELRSLFEAHLPRK